MLGLGSSLSTALLGSTQQQSSSSATGTTTVSLSANAQGGLASVSYSSTLRSLFTQIAAAEEVRIPYFHPAILLSSSSSSQMTATSTSSTKDMRRVWLCKSCDAIVDSDDATSSSSSLSYRSSNNSQNRHNNAAATTTAAAASLTPLCPHCDTPAPPLPLVSSLPTSHSEQSHSSLAQQPQQVDPSASLAFTLVNDSLVSLSLAADSCARAGARTVTKSSKHPLASMTDAFECGSVFFGANPGSSSSGTTSLWMTFDPRCSTDPSDVSSYVLIFADESDPAVTGHVGATGAGAVTSYSPLKAARALEMKRRSWTKILSSFASQFEGADRVVSRLLSPGNAAQSGGRGGVSLRSRDVGQNNNESTESGSTMVNDQGRSNSNTSSSSSFSSCRLIACLSGPAHMFQPLMISNCDSLLWVIAKGRASPGRTLRQSVPDGGWGMQFTVTPFTDITWGSERSVPRSTSLLWAFYQFDYLLSGSALSHELLTKGTLHNGRLIAAFFDYLRTSGAPFKEKIVLFLHSLFASPEYLIITPSHIDYTSWGTKQTVEMIKNLNVSSSFLVNNPAVERLLLQRITCLPLDAADLIRFLALDMKSKAEMANVMFLPRQLQQLLELAAAAECALKRARIQLQVLCATRGEIYDSMDLKGNGLLVQLNGGGTAMMAPAATPTVTTLSSISPLSSLPVIADAARVIFATSARCDASVPAFKPSEPFDLATASAGQPPLMLVKPQLISTMTEVEALAHLRDLLLCLVTGRRVPDAWILRATLLATRLDPNDVSGLSTDLIWRAHHACSSFSIPEDEATVALMVSYSARLNLGGSLEIQPSRFEMTEADASSYPLLDKFRVKKNDGSDDICGFALRIRMSIILVINSLLKRCIQYIDMSWSSDDANLTAFSGSAHNNNNNSNKTNNRHSSSVAAAAAAVVSATGSSLHYLHSLSVGAMLRRVPHLILVDAKENLIQKAIEATEHSGESGVRVLIDNQKAMASAEHNVSDPLFSLCTFAQLTRYMIEGKIGDRLMRCKLNERETLFEVMYVSLAGEHEEGKDWGGMYRDTLSRCMEDLFGDTPGIDLFLLSPNAAAARALDDTGATSTVGGASSSGMMMMNTTSMNVAGGGGGGGSGVGRVGGVVLPPMVTSVGDGMFLPNPRYCPANITPGAEAASFPFFSSTTKVPKGRPMMMQSTFSHSTSTSPRNNPINASSAASSTSSSSSSSSSSASSSDTLSISPQLLALASTMYAWVGRVFGIAIRTHASDLEADLSAVVWKLLVDEPLTLIDISSIDSALGGHLLRVFNWEFDATRAQQLRQERKDDSTTLSSSSSTTTFTVIGGSEPSSSSSASSSSSDQQQHRNHGSSTTSSSSAASTARDAEIAFREEFGSLRFLLPASSLTGYPLTRFDTTSITSSSSPSSPTTASSVALSGWCCISQHEGVPLTPLGANELVSASQASRSKYVSLVVQACIAPYQYQVACMRHGMAAVVPSRALALCGWRDMLRLVCGDAAIDIENLYRNTKYDSNKYYHEQHPVIINFWKAMRELTPEQKRNFIRFAWGRSRLPRGKWPINSSGVQVKFTIVPRKGHLTGIPLSHTCFFLIELPEYPTLALLRKNLLLAITYGAGEGFLIA